MRPPLGQHFLRDPKVLRTILAAAELDPDDTALEIGPGKGVLTGLLAPLVQRLTAVELDSQLADDLQQRFAQDPRITVVHEDFLRSDLDRLFPEAPSRPIKVLGNLPYSITSPIFEKLLAWPHWRTGVFLVQLEVAERMRSAPGSRTFGILSLAVQLFAGVESILLVKPGAFRPPPKVRSSVIRLRRKETAELPASQLPVFFDLAHGAFAHRRKTLANSLALHAGISRAPVEEWLRNLGMDPGRRAETFGLVDYVRMTGPWANFRRQRELT